MRSQNPHWRTQPYLGQCSDSDPKGDDLKERSLEIQEETNQVVDCGTHGFLCLFGEKCPLKKRKMLFCRCFCNNTAPPVPTSLSELGRDIILIFTTTSKLEYLCDSKGLVCRWNIQHNPSFVQPGVHHSQVARGGHGSNSLCCCPIRLRYVSTITIDVVLLKCSFSTSQECAISN